MTTNKEFLGTEKIGKLLFKLSIPTVVAQLINMLYNIIDRIYIGHMPGDGSLALTGVGVCLPLILIVSAFAAGGNAIVDGYQGGNPNNAFKGFAESIGDFLSEDGNKLKLNIDQNADVYFQKETFGEAMGTIEQFIQALSDDAAVKDFREKLLKSKVLVLINDNDPITRSIEQIFLDINEKAALLEPEDIFKGYCFKNTDVDFHEELRAKWVAL